MIRNPIMMLSKKELTEQARTYKILIVCAVFLFFGLVSPVTAKYMPEIVKMVGNTQNINIQLPEPKASDAISQYIKNISQICVFVLIFIFMGMIAQEKEKSTAAFLLVKPVKRTTFIIAKYISHLVIVCMGLFISWLACTFYTVLLFNDFSIIPFLKANAIILLYILIITSITLCFSTVFKGQAAAGILAFIVWIAFALISNIRHIGKFFPGKLLEESSAVIAGMTPMWEPFLGAAILIAVSFLGALLYFKRWEAL